MSYYLKAAELMWKERFMCPDGLGCCPRISDQGHHPEAFVAMFKPNVLRCAGFWMDYEDGIWGAVTGRGALSYAEALRRRLIALCLAHAMYEAGDLK